MPYRFSSLKPIIDILSSFGELSVDKISRKARKKSNDHTQISSHTYRGGKSYEKMNCPTYYILYKIKYYENGITIPQKSLKTREERIQNARNTIYVHDKNISNYIKVLLIDDFVGSGATMNETAKKLKDDGVNEVIGFALVGNLNLTYDVIHEI